MDKGFVEEVTKKDFDAKKVEARFDIAHTSPATTTSETREPH